MIIKNILLPTNITLQITGGPCYNSSVIESGAGWSHTNINWAESLMAWKIRYTREAKRFDPLIAFFHTVKGRGYGFLFKDWTDYTDRYVDAENGISISIGKVRQINGVYRLVKEYPDPSGGAPYQRVIQRPVSGTVTFSGVSGSPVVDHTTGIVSGATSEGNASFEFYVPVRFDSDRMDFQYDAGGVIQWADVGISEIRVSDS